MVRMNRDQLQCELAEAKEVRARIEDQIDELAAQELTEDQQQDRLASLLSQLAAIDDEIDAITDTLIAEDDDDA